MIRLVLPTLSAVTEPAYDVTCACGQDRAVPPLRQDLLHSLPWKGPAPVWMKPPSQQGTVGCVMYMYMSCSHAYVCAIHIWHATSAVPSSVCLSTLEWH